jgi:hypothetical protein
MSRGAGCGSSGGFFLSGFGGSGAGSEPEAVVSGLEDVAVVGKPVQQGGGHFGIAEHVGPFAEAEVGGDDDAGAFVEFAEQVEQQRSA